MVNSINRSVRNEGILGSSKRVRGVALDMDGLLLNTEDLYEEVGKELLRRRGKEYRDEVRTKMIGLPAPKAFGVLIENEGLKDTWQELQRETDEIFELILEERLTTMTGVEKLLDTIENKGLPKGVATSSTRNFARRALGLAKIMERMDFLVTAEDVKHGKPHPDIYQEAASLMKISPLEMLVLEDSENGTKAGVAANSIVISVPNAHTRHGSFKGAHMIADTLHDTRIYEFLEAASIPR